MTFKNPLVLDGETVKLRLLAERQAQSGIVHVDWLRFTCPLRQLGTPIAAHLFPNINRRDAHGIPLQEWASERGFPERIREARILQLLNDAHDNEFEATVQALEMAQKVVAILGQTFQVAAEIGKGHDFFKYRWPILRAGHECGWVGFLASSDHKNQRGQAESVHVNLFGHACTFAQQGWREKMADLMDESGATVTRCDLALDFFDGAPFRMDDLHQMSRDGVFNHKGKRPKVEVNGNWTDGKGRSFYIGSKTAGKQTNVYEKGHELYGDDSNNPWVRVELRWGNKLRELPIEMLRRPDDHFAAASDWHHATLQHAGAIAQAAEVPCHKALPLKAVEAEVHRNFGWALRIARSTFATLHQFLDIDTMLHLVDFQNVKRPGRLSKFSEEELRAAYASLSPISTAEASAPSFAMAV